MVKRFVFAVFVLMMAPVTSHAQGLKGLLKSLGKELDKAAAAADQQAALQGEPIVRGPAAPDSVVPKLSITVVPAREACGKTRACVAKADLRVMAVTLPGQVLPVGKTVLVTVEIDNRGRTASQPTELLVHGAYDEAHGTRVDLPFVPGGGQLTARVPLKLQKNESDRYVVSASLDPDNIAPDADRTNDSGDSQPVRVDAPWFEWLVLEAPNDVLQRSRFPFHFMIRNGATASASQPAEVAFTASSNCAIPNMSYRADESRIRLEIPALQPRGTYEATVLLPVGDCYKGAEVTYRATVDPSGGNSWSYRHKESASVSVRVK